MRRRLYPEYPFFIIESSASKITETTFDKVSWQIDKLLRFLFYFLVQYYNNVLIVNLQHL
jgi:hypothetical protein